MISIEQIKKLDNKIQEAVELISQYKEENRLLKNRLSNYEGRIAELENLIDQYRDEQGEIEQGIINALEHLDSLENVVGTIKEDTSSSVLAEQEADAVQREIEAREAGLEPESIVDSPANSTANEYKEHSESPNTETDSQEIGSHAVNSDLELGNPGSDDEESVLDDDEDDNTEEEDQLDETNIDDALDQNDDEDENEEAEAENENDRENQLDIF